MTGRLTRALVATALATVWGVGLSGCGDQSAREVYGGFSFVSPGGLSDFWYPPEQRGVVEDLSGPDVASEARLTLSDWAGQVVVINVWGSWCGPCRGEADDLNRAADALRGRGVQFLGINVRDSRDAAAGFIRSKQVPYPSIFDPTMRSLLAIRGYPTGSLPSTLILDRQRRVAQIFLRVVSDQELIAVATRVAQEGADPTLGSAPASVNGSHSTTGGAAGGTVGADR